MSPKYYMKDGEFVIEDYNNARLSQVFCPA